MLNGFIKMSHLDAQRRLFVLLTLTACVAVAGVAGADGPDADLQAFTLRSSQPAAAEVEWDPDAVRQATAATRPVRVPAFPLATDLAVDLDIEPFSVTGPQTRFVIGRRDAPDEPLDFDPRNLALFHGSVTGHPGSRVFLALSERSSTGYVDLGPGRERYRIASKDETGRNLPPGRLTVFRTTSTVSSLPPGVPLCGLDDNDALSRNALSGDAISGVLRRPAKGTAGPAVGLKHLELAIDTDLEFSQLFGDAAAAAAYLVALYAEVSVIYLHDVDVWVDLVFARIWQEPDPFDGDNPLPEFRDYWNANMGDVERDVAQLLSGRRNYPFGGQASGSVLCSPAFGYSVVGYALGFFPDPSQPSPYHYDIHVTAHELGHTAGTGHTHSQGIDACNDPLATPQRGTIMSYCSQTYTGQNANTDLYLHRLIQQNIDAHVAASACIAPDCNLNGVDDALDVAGGGSADDDGNGVPDECEDCNDNDVLDSLDVMGASADADGNGVPDECQPDCNGNSLPDAFDVAQATSTDAYGNDVPDECEADCNANEVSDYTDIQLDMALDVDRNAVLDSCQDCDGDGTDDLTALGGAHGLWMGSGEPSTEIRRFHGSTGVLTGLGTDLVDQTQDLLVTPGGRVLVTSAGDHRVMEFDAGGSYLGDLVAPGAGGLLHPTGLLLLPGGTLLVASRDTDSVLAYDAIDGTPLGAFVSAGSGGLVAPFGLTSDRLGDLYVTSDSGEVLRYDGTSGAFLGAFVSAAANGGLDQPRGLTFKGDGNLLVASFGSDEVLEFDGQDGTTLGKWAQVGTATVLTQSHPWGIRVGPGGNVYVARTGDDHGHVRRDRDGQPAALHLTDAAIYEFDVTDGNFVRTLIGGAGHGLEFPTAFDFIPGWQIDCNLNHLPDSCDVASGTSADLDLSGIPDECEVDCNANGILDRLDVIPFGASFDANANLVPDECEALFTDGFESGDTTAWSASVGLTRGPG